MTDRVAGGTIGLLPLEELDDELRTRLAARVERLGYLGGFFRVAGHQPAMLAAFIDFTEAGKNALSPDLVELVALTCAAVLGNDYERHQHEWLAVRTGLGGDWVAAVESLDPDSAELPTQQRVAQRYVLDALRSHGHDAGPALQAMVSELGEEGAVGVMLVCGRYLAHALLVNSCAIEPPVRSIFDEERPSERSAPT